MIALGMRHAERVDAALRAALSAVPDDARAPGTVNLTSGTGEDVESFFAEDAPEPFFVKNLELARRDPAVPRGR